MGEILVLARREKAKVNKLARNLGRRRLSSLVQKRRLRIVVVQQFSCRAKQKVQYFLAQLPAIEASWSRGKTIDETTVYVFDYKKEPYFAMISAAYVAYFLCGLCREHAAYDGLAGTVA